MNINGNMEIAIAREDDLDGILELLAKNQISNGGNLSASFSRTQLRLIIKDMPLLVARRGNHVVGFLISSTREMSSHIPIILAMLDAYPAQSRDAYVYGPICIDAQERGKGLAQLLFQELRRLLPGREGILFIRSDNQASIKAHRNMGMKEVAHFSFEGVDHILLSYLG